jgi:hypothetical protein
MQSAWHHLRPARPTAFVYTTLHSRLAIQTSRGSPEPAPRRHIGWLPFVGAIDGSGPGRRAPYGGRACAASPAKNTPTMAEPLDDAPARGDRPVPGRLTRRQLRRAPRTARSGRGAASRRRSRAHGRREGDVKLSTMFLAFSFPRVRGAAAVASTFPGHARVAQVAAREWRRGIRLVSPAVSRALSSFSPSQ